MDIVKKLRSETRPFSKVEQDEAADEIERMTKYAAHCDELIAAYKATSAQEQLFRLWRMLDDIDTLDDACRDNDAAFRALVRDIQRKRFEVLTGDGFDALWRMYGPNVIANRPGKARDDV